jgi:hypothetical protein
MEEKDEKPFDPAGLEVSELEDENLEGVTGGASDPTIVINTAAGCGVK